MATEHGQTVQRSAEEVTHFHPLDTGLAAESLGFEGPSLCALQSIALAGRKGSQLLSGASSYPTSLCSLSFSNHNVQRKHLGSCLRYRLLRPAPEILFQTIQGESSNPHLQQPDQLWLPQPLLLPGSHLCVISSWVWVGPVTFFSTNELWQRWWTLIPMIVWAPMCPWIGSDSW